MNVNIFNVNLLTLVFCAVQKGPKPFTTECKIVSILKVKNMDLLFLPFSAFAQHQPWPSSPASGCQEIVSWRGPSLIYTSPPSRIDQIHQIQTVKGKYAW